MRPLIVACILSFMGASAQTEPDSVDAEQTDPRPGDVADELGRPSSVRGRFAFWCLADIYRNVAASTSDSRIASTARRAAAQYERAGPTREQYRSLGLEPGDSVTATLGASGTCTTRVR